MWAVTFMWIPPVHGFVDESAKVSIIEEKYLNLPDHTMWVITDSQSEKNSSFEGKLISGVIQRADTVDEMARKMNISAITLANTLDRYNDFVEKGFDSDFGKKVFTQKLINHPTISAENVLIFIRHLAVF